MHSRESWDFSCIWVSLPHDILFFPNTLKNYFYFFIHLFLAVLCLHGLAWSFSNCGKWGLPFLVLCGLLVAGLLLWGTGSVVEDMDLVASKHVNLPRPGIEPMVAGGFLTTGPPRKSLHYVSRLLEPQTLRSHPVQLTTDLLLLLQFNVKVHSLSEASCFV